MTHHKWSRRTGLALLLVLAAAGTLACAEEVALPKDELTALKNLVNDLMERDKKREIEVVALKGQVAQLKAQALSNAPIENTPEVRAMQRVDPSGAYLSLDPSSKPAGPWTAPRTSGRNIDVSANLLVASGTSTEGEDTIQTLQGGGHDPKKRGFTLQQLELSLTGAVDPYFKGEAHIIYALDALSGESIVELEEAFATTTGLPGGMELEVGHFFTEFGRLNPVHPHAWDFLDQPIVLTRMFGGDGMRGPGARLGWLLPTPWWSQVHLGIQNANGETMYSFLNEQPAGAHGHSHGGEEGGHPEEGVGGRPIAERRVKGFGDLAYLLRWENSVDLSDETTVLVGASGMYGPNSAGSNGQTWIGGVDLTLKWRPSGNNRGYPYVTWQSEFLWRHFKASRFVFLDEEEDPPEQVPLAPATLNDWGFYTQVLWGFRKDWTIGARFEYASGDGQNVEFEEDPDPAFASVGRNEDFLRNERYRISPVLQWRPSEFSRVRFQYNFDHAPHLEGNGAHSLWLGLDLIWGSHPPHKF